MSGPGGSGVDAMDAALVHHRAGRIDDAIAAYRAILDADPGNPDAWHLLGVAAHQKGNHALARALIDSAITLDGTRPEFHSNRAQVLRAAGDDAAAEDALHRALALDPGHAKALANLASLRRAHGRFAEALDAAERAAAAAPSDAEVLNNLGNARKDAMRTEDALEAYDRALALAPDHALAHWNRALALLALGRYGEGFAEAAWRKRWGGFPAPPRGYAAPAWSGEPVAGKTLFLYPEQGLGDTVQMVRFTPLARARDARVVLEAPPELAPLVRSLADEVVSAPPPAFDAHASLFDLPAIFQVTADTIPARTPYLDVDPARVAAMRARIAGSGALRVGLNWRGNVASPVERFRSVPEAALAPLAAVAGIDWVCLQKGPGGNALARPFALIETGEAPLAETAALIAALDLVVSTDTAVAHLAGALGVPTLVMLHHAPDWRWMPGHGRSLWYPSARLFRQAEPGAWGPVVAAVAEALRARV